MSRILRLYIIREVALPTLLALVTITFVLLIGVINRFLISLLMQPNVKVTQVLGIIGDLLPAQVFVFAIPIAILIGVLVGVGRMGMDRELIAIRASGINMFVLFYPAILIALAISLAMWLLTGGLFPHFFARGMERIDRLKFAFVEALEPGRLHEDPGNKDNKLILFFRERDPKTHDMLGITIKLDELKSKPVEKKKKPAAEKSKKNAEAVQKEEPTLIFAERGAIRTAALDNATTDMATGAIMLRLQNGSIHRLNPNPAKPNYLVLHFDELERTFFDALSEEEENLAMTNAELRTQINDQTRKREVREKANKVLIERHSTAWAGFVFALVGIPLALWIRPTGKSWGIMIAIGLVLVYYLLSTIGLKMVAVNQSLGVLAAFLPNLLFIGLGAALWWHNLRS